MRSVLVPVVVAVVLLISACSQTQAKFPTTESPLALSRVVLYRNGVGYFERQGRVEGDTLRLKVRRDHVNDLLKSLAVVERTGGKVVSMSMPLDPESWANVAAATLVPGHGSLAEVLDSLRGTWVRIETKDTTATGRILTVENTTKHASSLPSSSKDADKSDDKPSPRVNSVPPDYRITVIDNDGKLQVVKLSAIMSVTLRDGDVSMAFHRALDASAGQGMFQQIELAIRLVGAQTKDLVVSYVAPAPMWKPSYRVVLPEKPGDKALLQAWAVVDNTSGEDWRGVQLSLASGAPLAFKYNLHTPRNVERSDMTEVDQHKRPRVAVGEASFEITEDGDVLGAPSSNASEFLAMGEVIDSESGRGSGIALGAWGGLRDAQGVDLEDSMLALTRAVSASGLTRYDITEKVTVPEGSSTMVGIINQPIDVEEAFMFDPEGAGEGYENNPYRVLRFRNTTPFVLETGPIAIYSAGSFVGDGISHTVGANANVTIPFAVEPGIAVISSEQSSYDQTRLLRVVRGALEVQRFSQNIVRWDLRWQDERPNTIVYVRQSRQGRDYQLQNRPQGTEDLSDAYLIPIKLPSGKRQFSQQFVEQTPSTTTISMWDGEAVEVLDTVLAATNLSAEARAKLQPIVTARQEIGRIDTQIKGLTERRKELDQRANETRESLKAIEKDKAAGALRMRLNKRLEEFTTEADKVGREIVSLQSQRLDQKIALDDKLQSVELTL